MSTMAEDKGLTRSEREEKVLQFWKENKIFEKTLEKKSPKGEFVFYEGPPTANGRPGIHHLESRAFKDAVPRYKTMQGFHVPRKAGWDTHGLPVEIESEKKLGLKSKKEIEEYGIAKFNAECKRSVGSYIDEWRKFTERIGYWVNLDDAYFTYENSYIESVWNIIAHIEERKLLYKDFKVVPWCPRDGTALSSHELAQGYQDVKDLSLYVKFKIVGFPDAYFLAWTTTPWTLPGNLALAVGPNVVYVEAKVGKDIYVLAKEKLSLITEPYEILAEHKGSEMVGMQYEPIYNFVESNDKTFKVYAADFVTTEDGTGIVHTAVMYGQEDFELGTKVSLPKKHLVATDGTFVSGTGWLEGRSVVDEALAVDILKDLQSRGLLFGKENYTHSYPFCWRCKTRLIYYARDSWYIRMSELRDKLVAENQKINWEPENVKDGRFGEWLKEVKDWALSRERFWGTPLPVWQAEDGERIVVDSIETLKKYSGPSTKIFYMRHGQAESNVKGIINCLDKDGDPLTEEGKTTAEQAAKKFSKEKIHVIVSSPFLRTRQTAEIIAEAIGYKGEIVIEEDLGETQAKGFNGKTWEERDLQFANSREFFEKEVEEDENLMTLKRRVGGVLYKLVQKYRGQRILIVGHGAPLGLIPNITEALSLDQILARPYKKLDTCEVREVDFVPLPHNENLELDLHKPYIDEIVLEKDGKEFKRVKEVMDVWLDSGSMPFASGVGYPADFISEGIDQTRGWFYTLHAVGNLMEKGRAFKNAICLGLILDGEGKKMSKSVGNIVEPFAAIEKYGVDTLRLWMYSVNQPGENKNFDERSVEEINRRIFNLLDNVLAFYELYRDQNLESNDYPDSKNILDKWILSKLSKLIEDMTENIDNYKLLEPVRAIRDFMNDLSTWYLRRSRDRLKDGDEEAKQTLYYVLKTISKLLAPFAPFAAEELYQKLRTTEDLESVHLEVWPKALKVDQETIKDMEEVRRIVSLALEARSRANIKIRQPLLKLEVQKLTIGREFVELIKDEVNVKAVLENPVFGEEISLDTTLTPELIEEGKVREIIRSLQEMRKEKGLKPSDNMDFTTPAGDREIYDKYKETITKATNTTFVTP